MPNRPLLRQAACAGLGGWWRGWWPRWWRHGLAALGLASCVVAVAAPAPPPGSASALTVSPQPATGPIELPASGASTPPAVRGPDCPRALTLGLHEHGLLYSSRTGEGIDKDIADEMARRSGCRIAAIVMPRARIWQLIEAGELDFSLSAIADAQREKFAAFAWYAANKYYLLVRRDAGVRGVDDFLRHDDLKLGAVRSFRYGPAATTLVEGLDADHRVVYAGGLDPLFAILLDNRIQAMIIEPFDYPAVESAQVRAQTAILEFDDAAVPHGLVMSRKSLPAAQQAAWAEVIRGMRADGTVRRIFERYFPAEMARAMTPF